MKYLKRYSEAAFYQNHEHKSVIEDMLLDLRDSEFHTTCSIQNYHGYDRVRVYVSREKEFSWDDISYVISDIANYMKLEDYQIVDFTCKDNTESKVNPDDYEIKKMKQVNLWRRDPNDFSIKSETKDYRVIPHVTKSFVYEPGTFNQISKWMFEITFNNNTSRVVDKTNEELDPNTYFRAADKLKQWGHKRRPDVLTAWGKEIQDKEKNERKKRIFEEDKKLGQFQLKFESSGQIKFANCYLSLLFNNHYYGECVTEWLSGDRTSLWIGFLQGFHPVSEEDSQVLEWFLGSPASKYASSETGVIWLQDLYINIADNVAFIYNVDFVEKLPMKSSGIISIENGDFNEIYFANRREAIKFRNLLVDLFEGDIEYKQSNGKDFKEEILEALCHHEERPVELSEFEELIDKLRVTRLNYLYRD